MSSAVDALILDLLEWIGRKPRAYSEVIEAWRTSCPRLPVWEEANQRGFVERHHAKGSAAMVSVTASGVKFLARHRPQQANHSEAHMKFMVMVKASKDSEAGVMPGTKLLTEMGKYNEDLVKAGILLAGEGLHPSSKGVRVRFSGSKRTVIKGPFSETSELVAGFWLWQVKSREEAIAWLKRCPNPMPGDSEIELRQVFEADDFGAALTPELRAQEQRLRRRR